ncbi:MAG: virulence factor SrfB [Antarcticimicrobium sp.]|uniref:virulence factor SrfB n=1 Tax=Antarcticimicrobium sp. TaxID=2824147 RepID=UPI0026288F23|nr:virulence factor SrfB [Antarcticimicrobium sp.]MDF1717776.1 virulence factor SrfB [Antarcticimicrobium sp.]
MNASQHLAQLVDWRDEVTLVPYSGTQMLDFGFNLDEVELKSARFIERLTGGDAAAEEWMLLPLTGDAELDEQIEAGARPDDDAYSVRSMAALEPFLSKWVPVPVLRVKADRGPGGEERFDPGPTAWARMRTVELDRPDPVTGHTHRVQLALDTTLMARAQPHQYLAPDRADAEKARDFRLVSDPARMDWFLRRLDEDSDGTLLDMQKWVSEWLDDLFMAQKRAERPGRRITHEALPHRFEHWARYLAYLRLIDHAVSVPRLRFANTVSAREGCTPVDVELVLDVGNSRTCGILIERFPGEARMDLARSFPLEVRDLSRPEFHYSGLFESRVEFSEHRMGDERYASRSGRRNAFLWPSFVRIGPEALRLVAREEGTETASGLSSPKRYLWDDAPRQQDWRFHHHSDPNNLPRSLRAAMRYLNEAGDVLEQVAADEAARLRPRGKSPAAPAIRPRFSRASLFGFMLAEIIAHALIQVNAPGGRARRAQSELPRRLDRIILTLPTATTAQEQAIIRSKAQGALQLVWAQMGLQEGDGPLGRMPELVVEWDEASATQLVWLYSELTQKFEGRIDRFLSLKGQPRVMEAGQAPTPSMRLACIDIGGGTTDLMVTTYWGEAGRVLHPRQTFREGFRLAGDDLLQRIIASVILPGLRGAIEQAGGRFVEEKLRELFAGDISGLDQQSVQKRQQFALRVLMPLAVAILKASESSEEFDTVTVAAADVLPFAEAETAAPVAETAAPGIGGETEEQPLPQTLLDYVEGPARALGAERFRLADMHLGVSREDVDAIAREVFQKVLGNLSEMIAHLGVDVVLLTGRPSRLPAVRAILQEMLAVPPHRLVSMHAYRTGTWYPFRDPVTQRIGDPKSTVAVGGMLIALAESRIPNFKVTTRAFRMQSTARFIGEMDSSGQIMSDRLLFSDLDLDARKSEADMVAEMTMYAPVHLGSRQLPLERWTTTPLYLLDFASSSAEARAPLHVTFERTEFDEDPERETSETALRREAMREAISVIELEDRDRDAMKPSEVVLRLHTLGFADAYWIDTGLFRL